jgi:hypothetical protein
LFRAKEEEVTGYRRKLRYSRASSFACHTRCGSGDKSKGNDVGGAWGIGGGGGRADAIQNIGLET